MMGTAVCVVLWESGGNWGDTAGRNPHHWQLPGQWSGHTLTSTEEHSFPETEKIGTLEWLHRNCLQCRFLPLPISHCIRHQLNQEGQIWTAYDVNIRHCSFVADTFQDFVTELTLCVHTRPLSSMPLSPCFADGRRRQQDQFLPSVC